MIFRRHRKSLIEQNVEGNNVFNNIQIQDDVNLYTNLFDISLNDEKYLEMFLFIKNENKKSFFRKISAKS